MSQFLKQGVRVMVNGVEKTLTEQERADLIADYRDRNWSYQRIADQTGISASNISWVCLKYGIEGPRRHKLGDHGPMVVKRGNFEVRKFTPEEDAVIRRMGEAGAKPTAIAKVLTGRKQNSILGRMMTLARRDERALEAAE